MKARLVYNINEVLKAFIASKISSIGVDFEIINDDELIIKTPMSEDKLKEFKSILQKAHIELNIIESENIIDKIKKAINSYLSLDHQSTVNISDYLSQELNYSYIHLSKLFSEKTHFSIESYIILTRVDKVKDDLLNTNKTLTEIAYKFNYSSVSHLSRQFKKNTGLTPSRFKELIEKRKQLSK